MGRTYAAMNLAEEAAHQLSVIEWGFEGQSFEGYMPWNDCRLKEPFVFTWPALLHRSVHRAPVYIIRLACRSSVLEERKSTEEGPWLDV